MEVRITRMQHHVPSPDFHTPFDYWRCIGRCNGKRFDAVFDPANGRMTIPKGGRELGLTSLEEEYRLAAIVRNKFQAAAYGA